MPLLLSSQLQITSEEEEKSEYDLRYLLKIPEFIQQEVTEQDIKQYWQLHRRQLCLGLGERMRYKQELELEIPTWEQKQWVLFRLKGPAWTWKGWYE